MPTISFQQVLRVLQKHALLKEWIDDATWHYEEMEAPNLHFTSLSYDSRTVDDNTLFFAKGAAFKEEYLANALEKGLLVYVSEVPYDYSGKIGVIVTDVKKAMAVIAQLFYDFPEEKLTLVGITGTKGKTTTNYFIHHILKNAFHGKAAMASTEETTLDGKTYFPSSFSTPESLDLFEMFYKAVENHMTHFVMEVSSQGYKLNRVFNLTFDYGIFLNISPDHISESEHPNFDDYFYCKRQLLKNSRTVILNREMDYFPLAKQVADKYAPRVFVFGSTGQDEDLTFHIPDIDRKFSLKANHPDFVSYEGNYEMVLPGDFNVSNATAAIAVSALMNIEKNAVMQGIKETRVPGRMMVFEKKNGGFIYVDYAHNYISLAHMATYLRAEHPKAKIGLLTGSAGDRAYSRRADFGKAITEFYDFVVLTSDHPTLEDPRQINADIKKAITKDLPITEILDRKEAILTTCRNLKPDEVIVIAGKGTEKTQRTTKGEEPYDGDDVIVERFMKEEDAI